MPKKTAHSELDKLRRQAADERVRARDVEAALEKSELAREQAQQQIVEAMAAEDERSVEHPREARAQADVEIAELHERLDAAGLRVARAQVEADSYARERASELLDEEVSEAERITARLNAGVLDVLSQHRALLNSRQSMDRILASAGAEPRSDGAPPVHEWEQALTALQRVVATHPELASPRPRWHGKAAREERDRTHRLLQAQRA